jgi:hypothetical protein
MVAILIDGGHPVVFVLYRLSLEVAERCRSRTSPVGPKGGQRVKSSGNGGSLAKQVPSLASSWFS